GIILAIGMPIGAIAGYAGGRTDNLLMRFTDIIYAFPDLLLIILFKFIFGEGIYMIFLAIGLVNWTSIARLMRGQILTLKQREFVTASRAIGASNRHIIMRHLLPNSLGPIIVSVTFNIPRAVFAEAALSFIGIGVKATTPSWGKMIADGIDTIFASPYPILFPAIAIALLTVSFSFLGDGLRDALDPRITE
ncbi:ABC transporter permease, partial [Chloroflexota bacterium]